MAMRLFSAASPSLRLAFQPAALQTLWRPAAANMIVPQPLPMLQLSSLFIDRSELCNIEEISMSSVIKKRKKKMNKHKLRKRRKAQRHKNEP
ncbi:mitochondrial ribosomal protein S38 (mS38) [Andalucia godoyi]|uniref:Mitochondrial ribosomal protein S38 (MS38) n=1 Tax=Andalucia godoyi TaxID=505711 RepID=A0A8K0AHB0_ANDGO|nr:mitochondrial ribosomal protein S38 (mS38) [Andalucia godoyi]|eukprot:ANDGO_00506.mRNA.1 mitochondrial ribosomal protein S38 (mS38)